MANMLWKHFNLCFSNFKCLQTSIPQPSSPPQISQALVNKNSNFDVSPPPDFSSVLASERFFISSPGYSNSILDSPENAHSPSFIIKTVMESGVPVHTYSPDPYSDFRKSMQEMVEAREYTDVENDWDFLHELLLCYLMLNPPNTHKFIVGAFSDLLISLMASTGHSRLKVDNPAGSFCCWSSGSESTSSLVLKP